MKELLLDGLPKDYIILEEVTTENGVGVLFTTGKRGFIDQLDEGEFISVSARPFTGGERIRDTSLKRLLLRFSLRKIYVFKTKKKAIEWVLEGE